MRGTSLHLQGNDTYFDATPQSIEPEEVNFQTHHDDKMMRRTNPKRQDERADWLENPNEHGHDSDVANRYSYSLPIAIFEIEQASVRPTSRLVANVLQQLSSVDDLTRTRLLDYIQEKLDGVEYSVDRLSTTASLLSRNEGTIRFNKLLTSQYVCNMVMAELSRPLLAF